MFDVHPVHGAAHSWRDFLFHIATISAGLLLALGLERLVEYAHHRSQLSDARLALAAELATNAEIVDFNLAAAQRIAAALEKDLQTLRTLPEATPRDALSYEWKVKWPSDAAWQVVRQDGSLGLMPRDELHLYVYLYEGIDYEMRNLDAVAQQVDRARAIWERVAAGPRAGRDIEELVAATTEASARTRYLTNLLELEQASLARARAHPAAAAGPSR